MTRILSLAIGGIPLGAMYALQAMGIVLVYKTSGVFNFAQGAIGMVAAFAAAQLGVNWGVPVLLVVPMAVALGAGIGVAMEVLTIRHVHGKLQKTVVTLGWLLGLQALVNAVAPAASTRAYYDVVSPNSAFTMNSPLILSFGWNQLAVIFLTIGIALGLGWYFRTSAFGVAMRAVADAPEGATLLGINVNRVTLVSWGLGCGMGALAGILVTPLLSKLDTITLVIFTVQALAAALVGRLSSLPLTLAGGIGLGMAQPVVNDILDIGAGNDELVAFVFILVALLTRRQTGRGDSGGGGLEPVPFGAMPAGKVAVASLAAIGLYGLWALLFADPNSGAANVVIMFVFAMGTLSIVLLSGIAGQVSLCQASFMGVGGYGAAIAYGMLAAPDGTISLVAFLVAVFVGGLVATAAAVIVGLPALRLRGLELAIVTLSLAFAADRYFFKTFTPLVGANNSRPMGRPFSTFKADTSAGGQVFQVDNLRPLALIAFVLFVLIAFWAASLRRGRTGASFTALRSSIAATSAMGFSATTTKLKGFALSGFIAGIGGAVYAAQAGGAGSTAFGFDRSITLLAYAVIVGLGSIPGAVIGGFIVMVQTGSSDGGSGAAVFDLLTAVVLIMVLMFAPRGLTGLVSDLRDRVLRRGGSGDTPPPSVAEAAEPALVGADGGQA